ncbi:hypothetical protein KCV00_g39, partial [Aureobasidium melanogenum]
LFVLIAECLEVVAALELELCKLTAQFARYSLKLSVMVALQGFIASFVSGGGVLLRLGLTSAWQPGRPALFVVVSHREL